MWDMLYAMGIGISFSVGIVAGATLCRLATKEGRKEEAAEWKAYRDIVEERLGKTVFEQGRIADALAFFVDKEPKV